MLKSIYIDNYALIERLEIKLKDGLTIITGETGAGKTILLGALELLLGKRADTSVLKEQERKCVVEGIFNLEGYGLESFFMAHELDYSKDTFIRREISSNGKSRAFINDTPVTLDVIQELTPRLVDIHSQHQNLLLNNENYVRWIIDAFSGILDMVVRYSRKYSDLQVLKKEFEHVQENFRRDQQDLDYLTDQHNELHSAQLTAGELEQLEERSSLMSHAEEIKSALVESKLLLAEEQSGAITNLKHLMEYLGRISKHLPPVDELRQRTDQIYIELKDIHAEIDRYFNQIEFDPDAARMINERIDLLNTLLHKYRVRTIDELIAIRDDLDRKLKQVSLGDFELEKLKKELDQKQNEVLHLAADISHLRESSFDGFEQQIAKLLQLLGMKHAAFSIVHKTTEPSDSGIDKIQFYFSANKNIPKQNITKVASGGELSRLMLAIKYLISGSSGLPTIIFDEIDSGVSGEIADKVGNLIRDMATGMQVINITHLPQVASKGEQHFLVYKQSVNGTTKTLIRELDKEERLFEVARMLSGDSVTDAAIENAKVLLGQ
jgi:DNA repair protein RecN (Recombination protein N)